jgi:hypothetical protein
MDTVIGSFIAVGLALALSPRGVNDRDLGLPENKQIPWKSALERRKMWLPNHPASA